MPAIGCRGSRSPEVVEINKDSCHSCRMLIVNPRFGGEIISRHGKIFKFDSIDCLMRYNAANPDSEALIYVVNYGVPGTLIDARSAVLVKIDRVDSPMGTKLAAFDSQESATNVLGEKVGAVLTWAELESRP